MAQLSASEWDDFLARFPDCHILQTRSWGELKSRFGWEVKRVTCGQTGAQILFRRLPLGLRLAYIPRGPVGQDWPALWPEVDALCRQERAFFLRVEPDLWEPIECETLAKYLPGFNPGIQTIQPPRTIQIDLSCDENTILNQMKQKTRYNVHLAEKKAVIVRPANDMDTFHQLMTQTSQRDQFHVHSLDYYEQAYQLFHEKGGCELLQADYNGQPLAALMVFKQGQTAWYLYGASNEVERSRMPTYLLQWEAIRWAMAKGCSTYDLWGIPDEEEERLEAGFTQRADGLWGVYRFKRGFGGQVKRTVGAWDRVYHPALYHLYRYWTALRKKPEE